MSSRPAHTYALLLSHHGIVSTLSLRPEISRSYNTAFHLENRYFAPARHRPQSAVFEHCSMLLLASSTISFLASLAFLSLVITMFSRRSLSGRSEPISFGFRLPLQDIRRTRIDPAIIPFEMIMNGTQNRIFWALRRVQSSGLSFHNADQPISGFLREEAQVDSHQCPPGRRRNRRLWQRRQGRRAHSYDSADSDAPLLHNVFVLFNGLDGPAEVDAVARSASVTFCDNSHDEEHCGCRRPQPIHRRGLCHRRSVTHRHRQRALPVLGMRRVGGTVRRRTASSESEIERARVNPVGQGSDQSRGRRRGAIHILKEGGYGLREEHRERGRARGRPTRRGYVAPHVSDTLDRSSQDMQL